jgi:2-polyprenyl-6-methoxyphenol hydroxylase-like FAD-dependent oxidoreductase
MATASVQGTTSRSGAIRRSSLQTNSHRPRIIVIGGSIAGLLAANLFHRIGWDVHVFERTVSALQGRGAGITILPDLVSGLRAAGVNDTEESLGVELPARVALDHAGNIVAERPFRQFMTSWGRLFEALKTGLPADRYHGGEGLERIEQSPRQVTARFSNGRKLEGDLLIGADGLRSAVRAQFLPELKPAYAGYIAWRCLCDENELAVSTRELLFSRYAVCVAPGEQGIGYAVPGPDHSAAPGKRQFNVVWYTPVRENELSLVMTDDAGRHHANGIPPSLMSARVCADMVEKSQKVLAPQFAEAIARSKVTFVQPIVDLESPKMVFGRVAIIGDAAYVARPHVAMGVPKAAGDATALVKVLQEAGAISEAGLGAFEAERLRIGANIVARGRYLGAYMEAQLKSDEERRRAQEIRVAERVMMETAAPWDYASGQ